MSEADINRRIELQSAATEKKIAEAYASSQKRIKEKIAELYEKYSVNGVLTYSEMSKYNRMAALESFLAEEMKTMSKEVDKLTKKLVADAYEKSYYEYSANIANQVDATLNFGVVSRDTIASLISMPSVSGTSLIDTLGSLRYDSLLKEREVLTQGLISGESFPSMAKRLTSAFDYSFNRAMTIARTEGTRAAGEGQAAAYDKAEDLGIELVRIWVATGGARTRDAHSALNGKKADKNGYFYSGGAKARAPGGFGVAALDINCRCRIRSEVVTDE